MPTPGCTRLSINPMISSVVSLASSITVVASSMSFASCFGSAMMPLATSALAFTALAASTLSRNMDTVVFACSKFMRIFSF